MPATLEIRDERMARRFVDELQSRRTSSENGEGMVVSTALAHIRESNEVCKDTYTLVVSWQRAIFAGHMERSTEFEDQLRALVRSVAKQARMLVSLALDLDGDWNPEASVSELCVWIVRLVVLDEEWIPPSLSVNPSPRVRLPDELAAKMRQKSRELPSLSPERKAQALGHTHE